MGMSSPPKPPSSASIAKTTDAAAAKQQTYNTTAGAQSQTGSAVEQTTPYGSLGYDISYNPDGSAKISANQQLSQQQQQLLDYLQGTQATAGESAGKLLGLGNYGETPDLGTGTDSRVSQALKHQTDYLDPYFSQQTNNLDNQLRNQGVLPGMPAYDQAINQLRDSQNNSVSGFLAQAQPQAFQQSLQEYQLPAQMAQQLASFGAPAQLNQTFTNTPQANYQPVNYIGANANANSAAQAQYQNQMSQYSSGLTGMFGIGSAIAGSPSVSGAIGSGLTGLLGMI